jgi:dihydroneopterin aldolase
MDKVFIEALEIECVIGIYDWERKIKQPLSFDIEMAFDNRKPAASDDIADTLDYKAVSKRLIEFVGGSSFGLVETLAERCCAIILDEFSVGHVKLKLSKLGAVRGARAVGVMLERSKA